MHEDEPMLVRLACSLKLTVLEWHTVTVAWFHFSSSATGVPTILLRPRTTALAPAIGTPVLLINSIHPFGVHGRKPVISPTHTRPSLIVLSLQRIWELILVTWSGPRTLPAQLTHRHLCWGTQNPWWDEHRSHWHSLVAFAR